MERLRNDFRRNKVDLTTDPSLRLTSRPQLNAIFEDHGQTLVSASQKKGSNTTKSRVSGVQKFKPAKNTESSKVTPTAWTQGRSWPKPGFDSTFESDDEMDLFLPQNTADDNRTSQKTQDGCRDEDGKWHPYIAGFPPIAPVLSGLKFRKNKEVDKSKGNLSDTTHSQPTPSSDSLCSSSKSSQGDTIYIGPLKSKDPNSKYAGRSQASAVKPAARQDEEPFIPMKFGPPSTSANPRIKRLNNAEGNQPKPNESFPAQKQISTRFESEGQKSMKMGSHSSRTSPPKSRNRCPSPKKGTVRKLEAFPFLSPPASPKQLAENFPHLSPLAGCKLQAGEPQRRQKQQVNPFPLLSPVFRGKELEERADMKGNMQENQDASLFSKSGGAKERPKRRPKKFPMNSQMLQSIDSSPTSSLQGGKRLSGDSGGERKSKRSKKEADPFPQSPTLGFEEEGDSLLFSPNVDPRSLCPYCDTPLPESPSSLLLDLLTATKKKARSDPRPSNPLGLKAPVAIFVTVCQRHRFESQILPEAERKGWPKKIEWSKVANRILKMRSILQAIIEDSDKTKAGGGVGWSESDDEDGWEIPFRNMKSKKTRDQRGPRASSIFWNEVIQEIKTNGLRVVAGVRGQFANFEKAQPGYYGEQGSVIIHQTLYDMFPPSSMDASLIAPLTANEFIEKILVPEVALRLIIEDRKLKGEEGKQEALTILRESSSYGVFMFPEDGGEWAGRRRKAKDNQLGVGDMIVMQRAMKRRKELEEEGITEDTFQIELEREARRTTNNRGDKIPVPKPKARPLGKASKTVSIASLHDKFPRLSRPIKQNRGDYEDTDPVSGIETTVEISDSDSQVGWRNRKRSPSTCEPMPSSSLCSTNRLICGLSLSSDTDTSSRAAVGTRPMTRSRSRSVVRKMDSWKIAVDQAPEDIVKTPVPRRLEPSKDEDTPKAHRSQQNRTTPPLLRARIRRNNDSVTSFKQGSGTSRPPNYQDTLPYRWLLDDE